MRRTLSAVSLLSALPGAYSHAYLAEPKSRNVLNCPGGSWANEHHCTAHIMTHETNGLSHPVYPNNLAGDQYGKMVPQGSVCAANYQEPKAVGTNIHVPGPVQATYKAGDLIDVRIHVQANHGGHHAFRLCPDGETEECFSQNYLKWESGEIWKQFKHDSRGGPKPGDNIHERVRLPADVSCERCVLNWRWDGGGGGGDESVVFLNCVDIKIEGNGRGPSPVPSPPAGAGGNKVTERAPGVGGWGGSCTCPNGEQYQVGDNGDACASLACIGGSAGTCNKYEGRWSTRKVECAAAAVPAPAPVPAAPVPPSTPAPEAAPAPALEPATTQLKLHPGAEAQGHVMTLKMTAVGADKMKFELDVNKQGWISIGISEGQGSMTSGQRGTDVVFCTKSVVGRKWITTFTPDALNAVAVEESSCSHADGHTKLSFVRDVTALSDTQRALTPGTPQAVVYAYGEDDEAFGPHGVKRGKQLVTYPSFNVNTPAPVAGAGDTLVQLLSGACHIQGLYTVVALALIVLLAPMD